MKMLTLPSIARLLCCGFLAALFLLPSGCGEAPNEGPAAAKSTKVYHWKMVTAWPPNFPGLGTGMLRFAENVKEMSDGRLLIKVYGAGEIVDGFGVFDAVKSGTAEMGHSASYYWRGKLPEAAIFCAVPFGMNAQEMNAWLHYGGGIELWRELYAPHNIYPMAAGNTGVQMAGWFSKPIESLADFKGVRMRIPGLGGEIFQRAGGVPVSIPGGEIFTSLQQGVIDAAEWIGPYNDLTFGFQDTADYYYYPGWHEPGPVLEAMVNIDALRSLPEDLRAILETAARVANQDILDEFTARNHAALQDLQNKHGVDVRPLPEDVLRALYKASDEVMGELAASSEMAGKIYASFQEFRKNVRAYHAISEQAFLEARDLDGER